MLSIRSYIFLIAVLLATLNSEECLAIEANPIVQADRAFQSEDWQLYEQIYRHLAESNPHNGRFWARLADGLRRQDRHREAQSASIEAIDLGYDVAQQQYSIARSHAKLGQISQALDWYVKARRNKLRNAELKLLGDPEWKAFKDREEFIAVAYPLIGEDEPRHARWRSDLDFLDKRMRETHFDLFAKLSEDEWVASIKELSDNSQNLSDEALQDGIARLLVQIGDGHTMVLPKTEGPARDRILPVGFYLFDDGLFVVGAHGEYLDLVGSEVLAINGVPTSKVLEALASVISHDNKFGLRWLGVDLLSWLPTLRRAGMTEPGKDPVFTFDRSGRAETRVIRAIPFDPIVYSSCCSGLRDKSATAPFWLANTDAPYWTVFDEDAKTQYLQLNQIADRRDEPLEAVLQATVTKIAESAPGAFVLDLRHNSGGDGDLNPMIMRYLLKIEEQIPPNRFFVAVGRRTFSAAMNLASLISNWTDARFIGEPTGSSPNFTGESDLILLPNSNLRLSVSSRRWLGSTSDDQRKWLAPHIGITLSSKDFFSHFDPVMSAIKKMPPADQGGVDRNEERKD